MIETIADQRPWDLVWFNGAMLAMVAVTALAIRRAPGASGKAFAASALVAALVATAVVASDGGFGILRNLALGGFVWLPVTIVVAHRSLGRGRYPALAVAAAAALVGGYAFLVEPQWLEVSRVTVRTTKLSAPVRVALLADLQADVVGTYERRVLRELAGQKADLIVLLGDYIQLPGGDRRDRAVEQLGRLLREEGVDARLGVFAVGGDVDPPGWEVMFAGTSVMPSVSTTSVDLGPVWLTGLSRRASGNLSLALSVPAGGSYHVVAGHAPDFALGAIHADLLLAGHTHGGQVQIPLFGPIVTLSAVPRAWAHGVTDLAGERTLVVSRGVGMERGTAPRIRFFCRPQIVVVDVVPAS